MQYFEASQIGQRRIDEAQKLLAKFTGYARGAIFLKRRVEGFEPVGEENLYAVKEVNQDTVIILLVDGEGNAKAISSYMGKIRAQNVYGEIEAAGIKKYEGELNLPA
jgi:hypothetical protein